MWIDLVWVWAEVVGLGWDMQVFPHISVDSQEAV